MGAKYGTMWMKASCLAKLENCISEFLSNLAMLVSPGEWVGMEPISTWRGGRHGFVLILSSDSCQFAS